MNIKPTIKELHYTKEEIAEVKRIQDKVPITRRKEAIRNVLSGPLCVVCNDIPVFSVLYDLHGASRIETYCSKCFQNFEKTKDVSNQAIAERYGIVIGEPNK